MKAVSSDRAVAEAPGAAGEQCAQNTDREIWRASNSYYAPSIHVTSSGGIGMNVGGHVIVAPIEVWHEAMRKAGKDRAVLQNLPS